MTQILLMLVSTYSNDKNQALMVEVKWSDENLSPNFKVFMKYFSDAEMVQIVKELNREKSFPDGAEIRSAHKWLSNLSLP